MPENRGRELRVVTFDRLEVRAEDGAEQAHIIGHAAVFNEWTTIWDFQELILPGAFARAIEEKDDVRALWNHDPNYVLGRSASGTLALAEDETGLAVDITPPDTQWARDNLVTMRRGDVSQMSFGFVVGKANSDWRTNEDGVWERTIKTVDELWDVSPVTFPAYPSTDAQVRAMGLYVPEPPQGRGAGERGRDALERVQAHRRRALELIERSL
jgi:Escherichia/Staphylococcus phage prohead protease